MSQSPATGARQIVEQSDDDDLISVSPAAITHAFAVVTHEDSRYADTVADQIVELNRACQPRIWNARFNAKFADFLGDEK